MRASQNADLYNQTCITFWDSQDWYLDPDYNLDPNHSNGNESYAYTVLTFTYACVGENYRGIGFGGSDLSASDNINSGTTANSNSILLMYQFDYKIVDSLPQCVKDILTTIKNLSPGKIASIINKFSDTIPTWNWKVIDSSLNINQYGNTSNVVNNNTVVTALDFNKLKTATDISVARTIIHEAVHAYLVMYFKNDPINAIKDYKGITDAWRKSKHPSLNKIQHDEMEKTFVSDIAKELELFGVAMGYNLDSTIYSDLAWGGLDFMNNSTLSDDDKTRIDNRLSVELTNTIINDINPVGKKLKCN